MTKLKNRGITLVVLVITIVVLLILAGITIAQLTENGLFEKARLAKEKQENAEIEEESKLGDYENKIGEYVDGTRDVYLTMHSPIKLVTAILPSTGNSTRAAGIYKASSSSYTKENTDNTNKYLTFEENVGWTVLKEGWYYLSTCSLHEYVNAKGAVNSCLYLNNESIGDYWTLGYISSSNIYTAKKTAQSTMYLNKGDVLDFYYKPEIAGKWSAANFYIYAMFE